LIKKFLIFILISFSFLIVSSGCTSRSDTGDGKAAVSVTANSDSEYVKTFNDLNLGILFDYDFSLPNADKRWVNLWVERYHNGKKDSNPLTQLSYGNSPKEVEEGHLGFGMINPNSAEPLVFLYGPGVRNLPVAIEKDANTNTLSSWDYAIGKEKVELKLGETKILAVYRETKSDSLSMIDYQDEESVGKMINQDDMVMLLKLKIEEDIDLN
jgi:hypothetical protein